MKCNLLIELLENRRLFSVGASVLSGPLTTGFTYQFTVSSNGVTGVAQTATVVGPRSFNSNSAIGLEYIYNEGGSQTLTTVVYEKIDSSAGFIQYGSVSNVTGGPASGVHSITDTYSPASVIAPPILTAGVVYSSHYSDRTVTVSGTSNDSTVDTTTVDTTIKLLSDTLQTITVPAGTFNCYHFLEIETDTQSDGTTQDVTTTNIWAAAGVGLVKTIDTDGSTYALTDFKASSVGKLAFDVQPSASVLGSPISPAPTVKVENGIGVVNTKDTSTVKLAILSGPTGAVLGGTTSVAAVAGIATFKNITLSMPGTYQLVATDGKLDAADSFSFVVAAPGKLAFTSKPATGVAGAALSPVVAVSVQSNAGQVATGNTSSITLAIASGPAGATLGGTLTVAAVKGVATFTNLKFTVAGTYTLKATDGLFTSAVSTTITITPAAASKLVITQQPTTGTAGVNLTPALIVKIEDAFGNIITTNTSTVSLSISTGPTGGTVGGVISVKAVNGIAIFSAILLKIAGVYALKATDGTLTAATSQAITIASAAAAKLAIKQQATTGIAGSNLAPVFTVLIEDAFGNVVTTNTSTVTLALATKPTGGALLGTLTAKAVKGVATFSALSMKMAGAYTIKATDGTLTSVTSQSIAITAAAASKLVFIAQPTTGKAAVVLNPVFTVYVEDAYGNIVLNSTATIVLAITTGPTSGKFTGTVSVKAVKGIAKFTGLSISKAGTYVIKASSGTLTAAISKNVVIST